MSPRALLLFALAALAGAAVAVLPALAAAPSELKLEVNRNCVEPNWPCWTVPGSTPAPASSIVLTQGGEVAFTDNSTAANIAWMGTAPTCSSGVRLSPESPTTGWDGTCRFEQVGTYKFESSTLFKALGLDYTKYEIVVEAAGTGTTTTTTTTAPTSTTPGTTVPSGLGTNSPLEGGKALKLAASQHGSTVHGAIKVSHTFSGGRLEVGLFAAGASLSNGGHRVAVGIGRLVRSSLKVGAVRFSVPMNSKGRASLRRHRRLTLTVKIALTPSHGAAVTLTRVVVVRA